MNVPRRFAWVSTVMLHGVAGLAFTSLATVRHPAPPPPTHALIAYFRASNVPDSVYADHARPVRAPQSQAVARTASVGAAHHVLQTNLAASAIATASHDAPSELAAITTESASSQAFDAPEAERPRTEAHEQGPRIDASWAGNAPPSYPWSARRMGEQGAVHLDVHIGADGNVLAIHVRRSSGFVRLDQSAMAAVQHWRFIPAQRDGVPIAAWYRNWQWIFQLEGS